MAERIWQMIAALPIPKTLDERGNAAGAIFRAFHQNLGSIASALITEDDPMSAEEAPYSMDARAPDHIYEVRQDLGTTTDVTPEDQSVRENLAEGWAELYNVRAEDMDLWEQHLIHRNTSYGMLVLGRAVPIAGPVGETDRRVAIALHDRLAALLAQWWEADRPRED